MTQPAIGLLDYGMGNLRSIANSCTYLGAEVSVIRSALDAPAITHLIIPGVGAYSKGIDNMRHQGLDRLIHHWVDQGLPTLGICLGMHLMSTSGTEGGERAGLALVPGLVDRIPVNGGLRLPHVGWSRLQRIRDHPVFDGVPSGLDVYFVHSYEFLPDDPASIVRTTEYGRPIVAAVARENMLGVQFHPEKSQEVGLRILRNFFAWDGRW